jgi:type III restriction enzyme
MQKLGTTRVDAYKVIVNDLLNPSGSLSSVIGDALLEYRPIREQEVNKKTARLKRLENIEIPRETIFYTDQYESLPVTKSAMEPFWIEKTYPGRTNEENFIKFLESSKNVIWWYKNGDQGSEYFSISYFHQEENKEKLFYPDWIVQTKETIYLLDTKAGLTAESSDTKYKAQALQAFLKNKKGFDGGIAVQDGPNGWKINRNPKYSFDSSLIGWEDLDLK